MPRLGQPAWKGGKGTPVLVPGGEVGVYTRNKRTRSSRPREVKSGT